ncbi:M42 family metallopeptidase [Oceanithermus sp.]
MERELNYSFFEELLGAVAPSGFEDEAARIWVREAETFADEVWRDAHGNSYARIRPGGSPRIMLAGHIDEIGLIVTYINDDGLIYVEPLGGWDPQVLVGQRVRLLGKKGHVLGVVGRKPIHAMEEADREKAVKVKELWIDIGAANKKEALEAVEVGSVGVIDQPLRYLMGRRVVSRAIDNRIGAFIALEALRWAQELGGKAEVIAVATAQEEIGAWGARTAAFRLEPDTALVVDVTHCSKQPGVSPKEHGEVALGKGPSLAVGPYAHPGVLAHLRRLAAEHGIDYVLEAHGASSGTDADEIAVVREGVPAAVVSVPNRYMHSPSEMIDLGDVEKTVELLARYAAKPLEELVRR